MKNSIFALIILPMLTLSLHSCKHDNSSESPTGPEPTTSINPEILKDTISIAQFVEWTNNWDSLGSAVSDTLLVRYFNMPVIDLSQVLNEDLSGTRFYNGLDIEIDSENGSYSYIPHLILCGVDKSGNLISKFFDVSTTCPRICPED